MTLPLRALSPSGMRGRLMIFTYHRVLAEPDPLLPDEATARTFARHMDWLAEFCTVLPLPLAAERLRAGTLPANAACVTFDDGYANNFDVALPILRERGLTASVFIAVQAIERGIMWNDLVIEAIRHAGGRLDAGHAAVVGLDSLAYEAPARHVVTVLEKLKYRSLDERWQLANRLYEVVTGNAAPPRLMMQPEQILGLARAGIDVGAHTVSHPILKTQSAVDARAEISGSRDWLAALLGESPRSFAYPNGRPGRDYDDSHVAMVRESGYDVAVSTSWGCATRASDSFQLPRVVSWDHSRGRYWLRLARTYLESYRA